ncbi:hypothetical protein [Cytobacillus firmus]|nr:hypothetical protein [Cytobacillus firmus]
MGTGAEKLYTLVLYRLGGQAPAFYLIFVNIPINFADKYTKE